MKNTALLVLIILLTANLPAQSFLHTKGKEIVTADGRPFVIKGTNLGNWLVPEGYMFHYKKATIKGHTRSFVGSYDLKAMRTSDGWRLSGFKYNLKFTDGNTTLE